MKKLFIKPDNIKRDIFIKQLETGLGVKLVADTVDSEVNGYVSTYEKEGKLCVVVNLYDEDEPANYMEGIYNNIPYHQGHKSSFVKVSTPKEKLEDIESRLIKLERV